MSLNVKCYPKGMYMENTYVVTDEATGLKAVIDPGFISDDVKADIGNASDLKYILLTHGHDDHYKAAEEFVAEYPDAEFAVPEKDKGLIYDKANRISCPAADTYLKEGDTVKLGESDLNVIETPGHTAGGLCFVTDNEVFTGDTLFKLSVGRSDLPTGDWDTLLNSIKEKLYTLDETLVVYPGHGGDTTIEYEKRANPFV